MQIENVSLATTGGGLKVNNEFFVLTVRGQALTIVGAWIDSLPKNQEMRIHLN